MVKVRSTPDNPSTYALRQRTASKEAKKHFAEYQKEFNKKNRRIEK